MKRQRRFAKYERELLNCGDDIYALERFCKAQVTAFRKILKKYKVCTTLHHITRRITQPSTHHTPHKISHNASQNTHRTPHITHPLHLP